MRLLALAALLLPIAMEAATPWRGVEGARFESVVPEAPGRKDAQVAAFEISALPVTNADFLAFVLAHPQWQRGRAAGLFVDGGYLRHWEAPDRLGSAARPRQPVVNVSWFAAQAYCEAQGARLPAWHEWEWSAAADATRNDARADPAWRQQILDWYAQPGGRPFADVGRGKPNVHGVHDLHGLVWEWVEDHGALMVSADNREQGDPDLAKFCGSGALSTEQKEQYAVLMRVAMLSSLQARDSTASVGFRCARDGAVR